ncbi:MAG: thioredoxin domain-containing protein [Bacteroidetes bacterium]|nr:thioredoxin domain-containing protein [Bacteroidota bacterium]
MLNFVWANLISILDNFTNILATTHPNNLISETSPYLLQHAYNPVQWVPWSDEAFEKAKEENKLVLISIGYSACHWCHVMEHESFEDAEVAEIMNKHFVNIKVDREERPDVDQIYMTAVQLMTQRGGWPLNCFTLPDSRPVYGGTYFPKEQWVHILRSLVHTKEQDPERVLEYAQKLQEGIAQSELIDVPQEIVQFSEEKLHEMILRWSRQFDNLEGGMNKAPKFPMPNNYSFLLSYAKKFDSEKVSNHVQLTLQKMALGGIYDQIGGGFARYSVDMIWKVPHFEKMLYDNAQLISGYSKAFREKPDNLYKETVFETIEWLQREMLDQSGAFYSALDADTEGEEGKFYCWSEEEFQKIQDLDLKFVREYYNINQFGFWEDEKYILLRRETDSEFAKKKGISIDVIKSKVSEVKNRLFEERKARTFPGLDYKCLTGWNAMTIRGLCDAYVTLHEEQFLILARNCGKWILEKQYASGKLKRVFSKGETKIEGFLEDYAHTIDAFIALYQVTAEFHWLESAKELTEDVEQNFMNAESKMCYFTSTDSNLIARKMELNDNVIPASNSVIARNFWKLGHYFRDNAWISNAKQMLANVYEGMEYYGSGYSNWGQLLLEILNEPIEINLVDMEFEREEILPFIGENVVISYHREVPMSINYEKQGIYICHKGRCLAPQLDFEGARKLYSELISLSNNSSSL